MPGEKLLSISESQEGKGRSRNRKFLFGQFELDLDRGCLNHLGEEVYLRPKTFAVLQYLLEHPGKLVSREELMASVWSGVVVTDDSLAQCLIEIRRALGDDDHSMIRTVPRRGLILNVPVSREQATAGSIGENPTRSLSTGWKLAIALAVLAVLVLWWVLPERWAIDSETVVSPALPNSIAVLRFSDLGPDSDQVYLADGLSEEIMHLLAQNPALTVIARTSSFAVEGEPIDVIVERLGVSHVLEGSVRREGDKIRVTAQLIDAATSTHIWSRDFDRRLDEILDLQREIAQAVAGALEVSLVHGDDTFDVDPRAYELFLEGRFFKKRYADGDWFKAQQRFEQALDISPRFARAWVELASVIYFQLQNPLPHEKVIIDQDLLREKYHHAVKQALLFGPNLAEAHQRAAQYYSVNGQRELTLKHVQIARSIDPEHPQVRFSLANELRYIGRIDEANAIFREEIRKDPLNFGLRNNMVVFLIWAGRYEEALMEADVLLEFMPAEVAESHGVRLHMALVEILLENFNEAAELLDSFPESLQQTYLLAIVKHALGEQPESDAALEQLMSQADEAFGALYVAEILAYQGQHTKVFDWLEKISFGTHCSDLTLADYIYYSPFLSRLEGNPAWEEYRSDVLDFKKGCAFGLVTDSTG